MASGSYFYVTAPGLGSRRTDVAVFEDRAAAEGWIAAVAHLYGPLVIDERDEPPPPPKRPGVEP